MPANYGLDLPLLLALLFAFLASDQYTACIFVCLQPSKALRHPTDSSRVAFLPCLSQYSFHLMYLVIHVDYPLRRAQEIAIADTAL
jgi:hypothetical protein